VCSSDLHAIELGEQRFWQEHAVPAEERRRYYFTAEIEED
jgi:hypothetical protein